jgi:hypothetical protein
MTPPRLARHYDRLTPAERFRLILAASGRGDEAERERLVRTGQRITLALPEHAPYAQAFSEVALLTYLELLDEAAGYRDALDRADDARAGSDDVEQAAAAPRATTRGKTDNAAEAQADVDAGASAAPDRPVWQRALDLALAAGFVLRTKADGWAEFCARWHVPPFLLWQDLPGFDRLQRALALAAQAAFTPDGMLRWLNALRPAGAPAATAVPLTVAAVADATAAAVQERVRWWSG